MWGYDYYGTTRTVDVHIRRLKLKIPLLDDAIISVKSLGYKLKDLRASDWVQHDILVQVRLASSIKPTFKISQKRDIWLKPSCVSPVC